MGTRTLSQAIRPVRQAVGPTILPGGGSWTNGGSVERANLGGWMTTRRVGARIKGGRQEGSKASPAIFNPYRGGMLDAAPSAAPCSHRFMGTDTILIGRGTAGPGFAWKAATRENMTRSTFSWRALYCVSSSYRPANTGNAATSGRSDVRPSRIPERVRAAHPGPVFDQRPGGRSIPTTSFKPPAHTMRRPKRPPR